MASWQPYARLRRERSLMRIALAALLVLWGIVVPVFVGLLAAAGGLIGLSVVSVTFGVGALGWVM